MTNIENEQRAEWVEWLKTYGASNFYDAFVATAQFAAGECTQCGEAIYLDIVEGGGVPDWLTSDGDSGCPKSPDTNDEGTGGHEPRRLRDTI